MKVEVAKLVTLECEINVMQDDFMNVLNDYDKTVESKAVAIKILQDAAMKIDNVLDERVNEMEGEIIYLEITINETKDQLKVTRAKLDKARK